ncbi:MAG: hypothetical protein IIX44_11900 [Clostridia bacterium]|nr:hypothetical protein [Clostridia bacterium]
MKSHFVTVKPTYQSQTYGAQLIRMIDEQIDWYENNSSRMEDDYIKANLKLIKNLAENIEDSNEIMFIKKMADTFFDIINTEREVIQELEWEMENQQICVPVQHNYVSSYAVPAEGFTNDEQIKSVFINFMVNGTEKKRSSFTANDYILRIRNLWSIFYADFEAGNLPNELAESIIREEIRQESPLLNAYNYIEELNVYVSMKIASAGEKRNWTNVRAALNTFGKALYKDKYEKVKPQQTASQGKDFSKYLFEGKTYGKSRLVLAVVQKYVEDYHPATFEELEEAFPGSLQGSLGTVKRIEDVPDKYKGNGGVKRYFIKEDEIIYLSSGEQVIVCTQWGASNLEKFIEYAILELGHQIEKIKL